MIWNLEASCLYDPVIMVRDSMQKWEDQKKKINKINITDFRHC